MERVGALLPRPLYAPGFYENALWCEITLHVTLCIYVTVACAERLRWLRGSLGPRCHLLRNKQEMNRVAD